jgi:hypothetical protein
VVKRRRILKETERRVEFLMIISSFFSDKDEDNKNAPKLFHQPRKKRREKCNLNCFVAMEM